MSAQHTTTMQSPDPSVPQQLLEDRAHEQKQLLLHIAASSPYDAAELAGRISRPKKAIHDDLKSLMGSGVVHIHETSLYTSAAARIIAETPPALLQEVHNQVLAELKSGVALRAATLVALTESGCTDETLLRHLISAVRTHPENATVLGALATVTQTRGHSKDELRLMQAEDAAVSGRTEHTLSFTDGLLEGTPQHISARAAILAAGAHIQANRLERVVTLYRHVGIEHIDHEGAWAVVAAVGQGDLETAQYWRATMKSDSLTSHAAGLVDLSNGLLLSVSGNGDGALDLLARSVSTLAPLGANVFLPETPAALAALVAFGRGEPAAAEVILKRALRAELGGNAGHRRHLLLVSWSLMVQGRMDAADRALAQLDSVEQLCDRDVLLYWALQAGIARRRTDLAAMRDAWREIRVHTFGMGMTLYDLLPLGEMMVVAARLRDVDRVQEIVNSGVGVLERLGNPMTWAAQLHWHGVQAAFQAEDPAALIPHANALVLAEGMSPYAATLAQAGNTWLEVLRGETNFFSVEGSVRALARSGHVWDAARLAGQAALQHPEREEAFSMMQLAREISKDQQRNARAEPKSSLLTAREIEVAQLVLEGQGYRAIGEQLFISPKTVEHHVARMRSRLGAASRVELLEQLHDIISTIDE